MTFFRLFFALIFVVLTLPAFAAVATFAGGCFWCVQHDFDSVPGVTKTIVGYIGGHTKNPTYKKVSAGGTGYYEATEVFYNPKKISYRKLLTVFWHNIDPTDPYGQFCDKGNSYRSAIFYHDKQQQKAALASKNALSLSRRFKQVVTPILAATQFYNAETYHQKYAEKNPIRYRFYRYHCGRDARLKMLWEPLKK